MGNNKTNKGKTMKRDPKEVAKKLINGKIKEREALIDNHNDKIDLVKRMMSAIPSFNGKTYNVKILKSINEKITKENNLYTIGLCTGWNGNYLKEGRGALFEAKIKTVTYDKRVIYKSMDNPSWEIPVIFSEKRKIDSEETLKALDCLVKRLRGDIRNYALEIENYQKCYDPIVKYVEACNELDDIPGSSYLPISDEIRYIGTGFLDKLTDEEQVYNDIRAKIIF